MNHRFGLNRLSVGKKATVKSLNMTGSIRRRLLDIGLVENTPVECVGKSPSGDPAAYRIRGTIIAIRSEDSANIIVEPR